MIVLSNRPASRLFTSRTRSDARSVSDGLSAVAANIPLARALQHIEFDDVTDDDPWWRKTIMTVKQALPVILPVVETLFLDDVYDKKPSLSAITARQERLFRLRKAQEAQEESIAYQRRQQELEQLQSKIDARSNAAQAEKLRAEANLALASAEAAARVNESSAYAQAMRSQAAMIQAGVQAIQTGAGQVVLAPAGSYEELSESEAAAEQIEEAFGWGFDDAVEAAIHAPRFDELIEATSYLYDYVPVRRSLDNTLPQCQLCGGPRGKILSTGFSGDVPEGEFFSSPLMRASIRRDLGDNVFGQIDLSGLPFGVEISGKHGRGRGQVALAHEFLHMADAMLKTGIPHDKIPPLATLLGTEGFAAYDAYRRHVGN